MEEEAQSAAVDIDGSFSARPKEMRCEHNGALTAPAIGACRPEREASNCGPGGTPVRVECHVSCQSSPDCSDAPVQPWCLDCSAPQNDEALDRTDCGANARSDRIAGVGCEMTRQHDVAEPAKTSRVERIEAHNVLHVSEVSGNVLKASDMDSHRMSCLFCPAILKSGVRRRPVQARLQITAVACWRWFPPQLIGG